MADPFVGRDAELAELAELRAAAAEGGGAVVAVSGEAGIGKSAVVRRFLEAATSAGATVLVGRAVADEGMPPFWPWTQALQAAAASRLNGLSPALLEADVPVSSAGAGDLPKPASLRFEAIDRTARTLRSASAGTAGGLVVVLEDLQWADEGSAQLLSHIASTVAPSKLLVVTTFREPPASTLLNRLSADAGVVLLPLAPLTYAETVAFAMALASRASAPPGALPAEREAWLAALHRRTGGNPLFVRELTRLPADVLPSAGPQDESALPDRLRRVVSSRLSALSPACQELLGAAAAIGTDIDAALLALAWPDRTEVAALVQEAVDGGILLDDADDPSLLRFSHDVVRDACYEALSRNARLRWHGLIADALDTTELPDRRMGELARHRSRSIVDTTSASRAVEACRRAGAVAADGLLLEDSLAWFDSALALLDRGGGPRSERDILQLQRADVLFRLGRTDDALQLASTVMADAEQSGRADLGAAAALVVSGVGGPASETIAALGERASALLGAEHTPQVAQVLARRALALTDIGRLPEAQLLAAQALEQAERLGDDHAMLDALRAAHDTATGPQRAERQLALGEHLAELARTTGRADAAMWAPLWRIDASLQLGRVDRLDADEHALAVVAGRLRWPIAHWHLLRVRACRALLTGRIQETRALLQEAADVADRTQDVSAQILTRGAVLELGWRSGEPEPYAERLNDAILQNLQIPIVVGMYGRFHALTGDLGRAEEALTRLCPLLDELPQDSRWLVTTTMAAEVAARLDNADAMRQCRSLLEPYAAHYVNSTPGIYGSVLSTLGLLTDALGEHDEAVVILQRAIAAETRIGALPDLARAQLLAAVALRRRGARGDLTTALGLATTALRSARRLGLVLLAQEIAVVVDELSGTSSEVASTLTTRERQIVGMLAEGRSNKEIARHLVLSERTVETHVRNVFTKLGLRNRTQVATWAQRHGPLVEPRA